jgi:glycosyltransferase involved in cell wall biosynthesis
MKKVILSVTNDLFSDQRVDKVCNTLSGMGFDVSLVGRKYNDSPKIAKRPYKTIQLHHFFRTGPLFYAEFNLRLFFWLLFHHFDIYVANDLDTLLPNLLVSKIKRKELVYDAHEYFLGILEIQDRPKVKKVWGMIEHFCFPKLEKVITVSQSIADLYHQQYGKEVKVVRNIPVLRNEKKMDKTSIRKELGLPIDKPIIIYQGNAIHRDRGGEEIVEAAPFIDNGIVLIVGQGDVVHDLQKRVKEMGWEDRVIFTGRVTPELLRKYTAAADIGVTFDKNVSPNHYYSLPNKLFEYIHAGIPIIASNLPERKRIIEEYGVGVVLEDLSPGCVGKAINDMLQDSTKMDQYRENCRNAALKLNWQEEEKVLREIYNEVTGNI